MKYICLSVSLFVLVFSFNKKHIHFKYNQINTQIEKDINDSIPTYNYKEFKPWLHKNDDKIYVINFWATWCLPCVKELPIFEKVNSGYKGVEVILVSVDFPQHKETKLIPFVEKQNIKSKVLHLNDSNEQFWIADVSEKWTGSIPATVIYSKDKRKFYEQSFTQEELETEIQTFIK